MIASPPARARKGDIHLDLISQITVSSPCTARWEDMAGDDKVRHCAQCNLNVHNFSAMTREEVNTLLAARLNPETGRLCGRLYRRADGTVLTSDCPKGLAAARLRAVRAVGRIAAAAGVVFAAGIGASRAASPRWESWGWALRLKDLAPVKWAHAKLHPPAPMSGAVMMGDICVPGMAGTPPPPRGPAGSLGPNEMRDVPGYPGS